MGSQAVADAAHGLNSDAMLTKLTAKLLDVYVNGAFGDQSANAPNPQFRSMKNVARFCNQDSQNPELGARDHDFLFADLDGKPFGDQDELRVVARLRG